MNGWSWAPSRCPSPHSISHILQWFMVHFAGASTLIRWNRSEWRVGVETGKSRDNSGKRGRPALTQVPAKYPFLISRGGLSHHELQIDAESDRPCTGRSSCKGQFFPETYEVSDRNISSRKSNRPTGIFGLDVRTRIFSLPECSVDAV